MLDNLKNHPLVKKALAEGEERVGRVVSQLLSNEKLVTGMQTLFSSAVQARHTLDRGVKSALAAVNLPTSEDVAELKAKLAELEAIIDGLAKRVDKGP